MINLQKPKCRVSWDKPTRAGTICNYVDEITNECRQIDWRRCPCGGIVRYPRFEDLPWRESERIHFSILSSCTWTEDEDGNWHTSCGQIHQFIDGAPESNRYAYCPYCGNKICNAGEK